MSLSRRTSAFTLIEVLIVVVIMAVMAGVVLPRYAETTDSARESVLDINLHLLRGRIEMYKTEHLDQPPVALAFEFQMTNLTNVNRLGGADAEYGPYVTEVPINPLTDTSTVVSVDLDGERPTAGDVTAAGGWLYDEDDGAIWPNNAEYY